MRAAPVRVPRAIANNRGVSTPSDHDQHHRHVHQPAARDLRHGWDEPHRPRGVVEWNRRQDANDHGHDAPRRQPVQPDGESRRARRGDVGLVHRPSRRQHLRGLPLLGRTCPPDRPPLALRLFSLGTAEQPIRRPQRSHAQDEHHDPTHEQQRHTGLRPRRRVVTAQLRAVAPGVGDILVHRHRHAVDGGGQLADREGPTFGPAVVPPHIRRAGVRGAESVQAYGPVFHAGDDARGPHPFHVRAAP